MRAYEHFISPPLYRRPPSFYVYGLRLSSPVRDAVLRLFPQGSGTWAEARGRCFRPLSFVRITTRGVDEFRFASQVVALAPLPLNRSIAPASGRESVPQARATLTAALISAKSTSPNPPPLACWRTAQVPVPRHMSRTRAPM